MSHELATQTTASTLPLHPGPKEHNAFTSSKDIIEVNDKKYIIRVLKMHGSTLVILGHADKECINEMAVAMPMKMPSSKTKNNSCLEVIGTTVIGDYTTSASQLFAEKLSRRFKRQVFVSHNVNIDVLESPSFETAVGDYVRKHTETFV